MAYSVLIAEDFWMARSVLENTVSTSERYELAASCDTAEKAAAYLRERPADLVLMDVVMASGRSGLDVSEEIKALRPQTKIVLITSMPEVSYTERARRIGVESFWYKETREQSILEVMDRTMAGESVYPENPPRVALGDMISVELTEREKDVLRGVVEGLSNREIAERLGIGAGTVKMHITHLLQKTGFRSRLQLAVRARGCGLVVED